MTQDHLICGRSKKKVSKRFSLRSVDPDDFKKRAFLGFVADYLYMDLLRQASQFQFGDNLARQPNIARPNVVDVILAKSKAVLKYF
ncbi:MAG: hypothetical protein LBJ64_03470 [Deltaproteobacteria bacterium]|nr:hypothetical protein [Deltaproteobacteria bacterium]